MVVVVVVVVAHYSAVCGENGADTQWLLRRWCAAVGHSHSFACSPRSGAAIVELWAPKPPFSLLLVGFAIEERGKCFVSVHLISRGRRTATLSQAKPNRVKPSAGGAAGWHTPVVTASNTPPPRRSCRAPRMHGLRVSRTRAARSADRCRGHCDADVARRQGR